MGKERLIKQLLVVLLVWGTTLWAEEGEDGEEDTQAAGKVDVRYVELKPTFVTNYGIAEYGRLKYLKADVSVKLSSSDAEVAVRYHLPALRNILVLLFSAQDEGTVSSSEGREHLREQALLELQKVLEQEEGDTYIEDILFTNFILQG